MRAEDPVTQTKWRKQAVIAVYSGNGGDIRDLDEAPCFQEEFDFADRHSIAFTSSASEKYFSRDLISGIILNRLMSY